MEWNVESTITLLVLVISVLSGLIYYYVTHTYDFWKKRSIRFAEPSFPFGNISDLVLAKVDMGRMYERFYKLFKGEKYGGLYEVRSPVLIITDLDLIKQVVIKAFNHFTDRALPPSLPHDILMKNLFFMSREDGWKEMRAKLTPTFTSGKMKLMYILIEKCSDQLELYLEPLADKQTVVDVKEVMTRFTLDIIASCAFGLDVNSLKNRNTEFFELSQMIFKQSKTFFLLRFFMMAFPRVASFFKMTLVDPKVTTFIRNLIGSTVEYRERNNVKRNDFLDLLTEIRNTSTADDAENKSDGLTLEQMAAQSFIFFAAGFETAASTTTFVLYELACNPKVQEKLQREVDKVSSKHGGHFGYQALQDMTYMDQVINETLRMHGSVPALLRKCVEPYVFPDSNLKLEKGMKVVIPMYAIHNDPDIYPNPEIFDPERFTEENIRSRHNCSFLPFGEGPRMCIGMRFGKMQVKAGLATIVSRFELSVTPETQIPVEISPRSVITTPVHPIKLRITNRTNTTLTHQ